MDFNRMEGILLKDAQDMYETWQIKMLNKVLLLISVYFQINTFFNTTVSIKLTRLYHPEISYIETSGHKLGKLAYSRMTACLSGSTFIQELIVDSVYVGEGSL